MKTKINKDRRQALIWTAPAIAAVALPVHAQTSECPAPPLVTVVVAPKCVGNPPIGQASFEISAPSASPIELNGIEVTSSDPDSFLETLETFPTTITDVISEPFSWTGPASDALTCLPLAEISITIEYSCEANSSQFETYDITALLIASIP
ncbi:hypothetical protein N9060_01800 [Arenicella sp.]|nr:hypothetical protein [Arenicella sp.]